MSSALLDRPIDSSARLQELREVDDVAFEPKPHLWTREEYYQLAGTDLFLDGSHVELIDGVIVDRSPVFGPHYTTVTTRLHRALGRLEVPGRYLRIQGPLSLGPDYRPSDPEPDGALVEGEPEDYEENGHPTTALLVIEVADTSLRDDRGWKSSLYASAGIREYWIVDLNNTLLEVRRQPQPGTRHRYGSDYTERNVYRPGELISCLVAPEIEIAVASFFRKPKQA